MTTPIWRADPTALTPHTPSNPMPVSDRDRENIVRRFVTALTTQNIGYLWRRGWSRIDARSSALSIFVLFTEKDVVRDILHMNPWLAKPRHQLPYIEVEGCHALVTSKSVALVLRPSLHNNLMHPFRRSMTTQQMPRQGTVFVYVSFHAVPETERQSRLPGYERANNQRFGKAPDLLPLCLCHPVEAVIA